MTTSDTMTVPPPPQPRARVLRRSRSDRVAAGVSSGLGNYFGVDPVLFRVLFATSAFFGGAGVLAYLLAWAAIPDEGTERAPVDGWIAALRARRFPVWAVLVVGGLVLWAAAFSWWAPGPFFPVIAMVVLLVVVFTRRERHPAPLTPPPHTPPAPAPASPASGGVSMTKDTANDAPAAPIPPAPGTGQPSWVVDARAWYAESREAARRRRRRSFPVRVGVLLTLVAALVTLGVCDAVGGIQLQWYFWTTLIVLGVGILTAIVTRRWTWTLVPLLVPAAVGAVAFAGSDASLHDGVGDRDWTPVTATDAHYGLAFGRGVLDLRGLHTSRPATFDVTLGAGEVRVIAPRSAAVTVHADVRFGRLDVDGAHSHDGPDFTRTVEPLPGATGPAVTVNVHLADGRVRVDRT